MELIFDRSKTKRFIFYEANRAYQKIIKEFSLFYESNEEYDWECGRVVTIALCGSACRSKISSAYIERTGPSCPVRLVNALKIGDRLALRPGFRSEIKLRSHRGKIIPTSLIILQVSKYPARERRDKL